MMQPYYQDESATIYHGNAFDVMPQITSVDLVCTDPPFNAGKEFANDNLSERDFRAFCNEFTLCLYKLNPFNIVVEVGKDDVIMRQEIERYFRYRYAIALNYTNSMRNGAVGYSNFGLALWFSNEGKCINRYKDRLDSALHNTKDEFSHPSPKEVSHYKQLIRMFSPEGGTVLDPFCGSGTTLIAAKESGNKAIGIEMDEAHCKTAVKRLRQESLFSTPQFVQYTKYEQAGLLTRIEMEDV